MNGGTGYDGGQPAIGFPADDYGVLQTRCNTVKADDAFLFLAFFASVAAAVLVMVSHRRGGGRHSAV